MFTLHSLVSRQHRREEGKRVMNLSARNQLTGTVKSVKLGAVMAEVLLDVGGQEIVSSITRGSAERLALSEGKQITVIIKATDVLIATED